MRERFTSKKSLVPLSYRMGAEALQGYLDATHSSFADNDVEELVTDCITDLLHFAVGDGAEDVDRIVARALANYKKEAEY